VITAATKSVKVLKALDRSPRLPEASPPVTSTTVSMAPARIPFLAADSLVSERSVDISRKISIGLTLKLFFQTQEKCARVNRSLEKKEKQNSDERKVD
jgi:hypothetical protein